MSQTPRDLVDAAKQEIREVPPEEARQWIDAGAVALDVREPDELAAGHLPDCVHIPRGLLEFKLGDHEALADTSTPICVYCKGGGRGALAAQTLRRLGYTHVVSVQGGYDGWVGAGQPIQAVGVDEEE